jgi:broad specificity phosphatase PhoE
MTLHVVYETHSTTEDNERGIATGRLGGRLSATGRARAAELGARRRGTVDAVYVSDLARAVETARIAFPGGFALEPRLRECDYGALDGRPVPELDAVRLTHVEEPYPGGESYRDVVGRTASLLADLRPRHDGGRVLLIGHAASRYALDHLLRGVPLAEAVGAPFDWRPGWEYTA